jgi:hypothetical protein
MPNKELYFDVSSETRGGSLYRVFDDGNTHFLYEYSDYNDDTEELNVQRTNYISFDAFWEALTADTTWFFLHPMFVHPEVRPQVKQALQQADWSVQGDTKWQQSHRRQWDKVLSDPPQYYRG